MSTDTIDTNARVELAQRLDRDLDLETAARMPGYTGIENLSESDAQGLLILEQDTELCAFRWTTSLRAALIRGYEPKGTLVKCIRCEGHNESCEGYMQRRKYSGERIIE